MRLDLCSAALAAPSLARENKHLVTACVDELLRDHPIVVKGFVHFGDISRHALVSEVRLGQVWELAWTAPLDLGIEELKVGDSVFCERPLAATHNLEVLLRHRPRSISPWPVGRQCRGFQEYRPISSGLNYRPSWSEEAPSAVEHVLSRMLSPVRTRRR
jgi:hypothetical protein